MRFLRWCSCGKPCGLLMLFDESPTTVTTTFVFGLIDQYWGGSIIGVAKHLRGKIMGKIMEMMCAWMCLTGIQSWKSMKFLWSKWENFGNLWKYVKIVMPGHAWWFTSLKVEAIPQPPGTWRFGSMSRYTFRRTYFRGVLKNVSHPRHPHHEHRKTEANWSKICQDRIHRSSPPGWQVYFQSMLVIS